MIGSFLDCTGYLASSLLDEAIKKDPEASANTRSLISALSGLETTRGKAIEHIMSTSCTMDANIKLVRRNAVLKATSLPDTLAKEAYHLPLDPAGSELFGPGLPDILERGDKLVEEKRSKALHEAAVKSVKTGKQPSQYKPNKHATPGGGGAPKKGHQQQNRKKKPYTKKGGQPPKYTGNSSTGGGKAESHP